MPTDRDNSSYRDRSSSRANPSLRREVIDGRGSIDSRTFDETREIRPLASDKRDRSGVKLDAVPENTRWHSQAGQGFTDYRGTHPVVRQTSGAGRQRSRYAAMPSVPQRRPWGLIIGALVVILAVALIIGFFITQSGNAQENAGESGSLLTFTDSASDNAQEGSGEAGAVAAGPITLTVTFAGDCTLGTDEAFDYSTSLNAMYENQGDPAYFLANVAGIFGADDLTVVNMEGTLTTSTARADKTFAFKGPADFASILTSGDVEAASLANNHSSDYGEQSLTDTISALDAAGIVNFGYDRIAYMDVKGVKVALIGTYELAEGEGIRDSMVNNIQTARSEGAQLVLVYVHWGIEREYVPNETQMYLAHEAIDAGADLVIGSHPHVIQGYEVYNGRYIVYSLGNFCFGGNSNPSDKDCLIFQQTFTINGNEVEKNDDVDFIACSISSTSSYNNYQPTPAEGDEQARILAKFQESSDAIASMAQNFG